jgi:hypothetical protein
MNNIVRKDNGLKDNSRTLTFSWSLGAPIGLAFFAIYADSA